MLKNIAFLPAPPCANASARGSCCAGRLCLHRLPHHGCTTAASICAHSQSETVVVAASVASWSSLGFPGGGPTIAADLRSGHCPHNCRTILEVEDGLNKKEDPKEEQKKKKSRTE